MVYFITKMEFKNYSEQLCEFLKKVLNQKVEFYTSNNDFEYMKLIVEKTNKLVKDNRKDQMILIDASGGLGFACAAKVPKMILAQCGDEHSAHMTREHNNAFGLSIGAEITALALAKSILNRFFHEKFSAGRHMVRIDMLDSLK